MKTRKASIARVDKEKCLDSLQDVKTVYRYSPISIFGFYETLSRKTKSVNETFSFVKDKIKIFFYARIGGEKENYNRADTRGKYKHWTCIYLFWLVLPTTFLLRLLTVKFFLLKQSVAEKDEPNLKKLSCFFSHYVRTACFRCILTENTEDV